MTTAPAPSQRTSPCAILEGDSLFKESAAIELIVNPTISSATAVGIDLTFTPYMEFTGAQGRVEFVSKLLKSAETLLGEWRQLPDEDIAALRGLHNPERGNSSFRDGSS
jgi:hypothetical protein